MCYELLSNPEPGLHTEGLHALDDLLAAQRTPDESGCATLQAALRVQEQHGPNPASQEVARTALERVRRAGQLIARVGIPDVVTLEDSVGRGYTAFVVQVCCDQSLAPVPPPTRRACL